jgi:hypothetical protein
MPVDQGDRWVGRLEMFPLRVDGWGGDLMTHTPGPWVAGHFDDIGDEIVIQTHEGEYVASIDCDGAYEGKIAKCIDANAALIAAAPDLLAALVNLYGIAVDEGIVGDNTTLEAARAAIAKAKGEA